MKMRSIALLVFVLSVLSVSAQWELDFTGRDFFHMRDELQLKYDSLSAAGDTSEFHEGGPYSKFQKWRDFWSVRLKSGTRFTDYFNAEALAIEERANRSAGNTDPWHEIGPKDKPSLGVASIGQGMQPGIGPIHFITFSDIDANKMLCGSVIGGLWYTDNQGVSWTNGGSDGGAWERTGCKYGVFKVDDPSTWYAANSGYFFYSGAILRGTNYGANWQAIADQSDFISAGGKWTQVNKLVTDHEDPDVLFAATEHRLWHTNNANGYDPTWSEIVIPLPTSISDHPVYGTTLGYTYSADRNVYDLEVDPLNSDNLYASVQFKGELNATEKVEFWQLMRSPDGGQTWSEMPNQPNQVFYNVPYTASVSGANVTVNRFRNANLMTIESTKANSDWLYVFFDLNDPNPPPPPPTPPPPPNHYVDQLYRISNVANGTWGVPLRSTLRLTYGAGNGFGVDQVNGQDVYIDHNQYLGRYSTFIDETWTDYTSGGNYLQYHVDVEDFVGDPVQEGVVWMANHGGIHRSADGGANWEWRGSGLAVAQVYRMKNSYSEPDRLITGLYHGASQLTVGGYGPDWEPEWRQLSGGDGQQPLIDHDEGSWIYWSSQGSFWQKSGDYGNAPQSMSAWSCGSLEWETSGAMDQGMPNAIYLPGWPSQQPNPCSSANVPAEVKRSLDRGVSWEVISDFLSMLGSGKKGVWRIYSSPYDPDDLLVHFPHGQSVFRTRIARAPASLVQQSWKQIFVPRTDRFIADIDFDVADPDVLYFAYSSEVMEDDAAAGSGMVFKVTYTDPIDQMIAATVDLSAPMGSSGPLPNTGIGTDALVLERGSNNGIYVATDLGVYYTNNELLSDGSGWQLLGQNLPHRPCAGLEINYQANKLRAGISGRGVWEHDLWCPSEQVLDETGTYAADAFKEAVGTITSTAVVPSGIEIAYRGGDQVRLLPGFRATFGSNFHAFIHPCDRWGNSFKSILGASAFEQAREVFDPQSATRLVVLPNPNQGDFAVKYIEGVVAPKEVRIFNSQGRILPVRWRGGNGIMEVSLGERASAGIYTLQVIFPDGAIWNTSVVVQP